MALFDIPENLTPSKPKSNEPNVKLKKGQTINDLIIAARQIVMEKLGKYKDASKCITTVDALKAFFADTDDLIGIDTETTGLNTFTDELVGISLCNTKRQAVYIPLNHKSSIYNTRLTNQLNPEDVKTIFEEEFKKDKYKWLFHNAKFDLAVLRTFFGHPIPDPYWDTMLGANLLYQDEDHNLKYLYNQYIAKEDEGVNRFDTLFKGVTFDYVPLTI